MDWIEPEAFVLLCPAFSDVFVGSYPLQCLEPPPEIVGFDEVLEVLTELVVVVVVEPLDGGLLDRAVHPLDLTIRPGMLHLGQPVLDIVIAADAVEDVLEGVPVLLAVGELDAVVSEHSVDCVGDGSHEITQELGGGHLASLPMQLRIGGLRGPVDGHEKVKLAFGRAHLSDVDVEITDRGSA